MPNKFNITKGPDHVSPYLKVTLLQNDDLLAMKSFLETSKVVSKCNITTRGQYQDLTVQIKPNYTKDEAIDELTLLLKVYYATAILSNDTKKDSVKIFPLLKVYPTVYDLYNSAIIGIIKGDSHRNALDNLRLSLELLFKQILGNEKSLEKQESELGIFLGKKGISSALVGTAKNNLKGLYRYFNEHVKHNNSVVITEIDYVVTLVNSLIKISLK